MSEQGLLYDTSDEIEIRANVDEIEIKANVGPTHGLIPLNAYGQAIHRYHDVAAKVVVYILVDGDGRWLSISALPEYQVRDIPARAG